MEIQQKEKESLTTYIHHFKREAKRCNFTNNSATIRIFFKGLKHVHTLATKIYEKGPQTVTDTISEVEKLQAAQQLTATLIPPSTVNVMSNEEDHCFQCQEAGHIAWHCPNVRCFECDEYGHIVVDCLHRILPLGTPAHHHSSPSQHRPHNRSTSHHCHEVRYRCSRSRSQSHPHRYHSRGHHDSNRSHTRSHHRDSRHHQRSIFQCSCSNTYSQHSCHDTPHQISSLHRSSSAYFRDHSRSQSQSAYKPSKKPHTKIHHDPGHPKMHTLGETQESQ